MKNHNSKGQFIRGNNAASGRAGKLTALRQAALSSYSPDDVIDAVERLRQYGMERDGDWRALIAWLEIGGVTGDGIQSDVMDRLEKLLAEAEERAGAAEATS